LAFQRDADRFVHAASGKFLGLFVNVFNGFFYCVSVIACATARARQRRRYLTLCGA
jgi:hypothetical protein